MIRARTFFVAAFASLVLGAGNAAAQPSDPVGEWLVAKRVARIRIVNCANRLWGVVSWETSPGVDSNNPDPSKRNRPTLGMPILLGMEQADANEWKGEIYNAEDGKTYSASISLVSPDVLKVQGCVLGILCGGENWTRVSIPATGMTTGTAHPPKSAPKAGTAPAPQSDEAICSGLASPAGLSH